MKRQKFKVVIIGPPGGGIDRLLECIRDYGYTVNVKERDQNKTISGLAEVEVFVPYGETSIGRKGI